MPLLRRNLQRSEPPLGVAIDYAAALREWLHELQARILLEFERVYRDPLQRVPRAPERTDVGLPRIKLEVEVPRSVVERAGQGVDAHVRRTFDPSGKFTGSKLMPGATMRVPTISIRSAAPAVAANLSAFREHNVNLIESLAGNQIEDIQNLLDDAWSKGLHASEVKDLIQSRFNVSESKADLLARDQVLKLNANITKARHKAAGITHFTWSTSLDERVREEHAELEGESFPYDAPPIINGEALLPGEDYQCRCIAIPVLPELDDDEGE